MNDVEDLHTRIALCREDVKSLERDVARIRHLMIKAVWKALQQGKGRSAAASAPAERRREFAAKPRACTSSESGPQKPFLPPDKFAVTPPLEKEKDFTRLNKALVDAVLSANRSGPASVKEGGVVPALSLRARALAKAMAGLDAKRSASATSSPASSPAHAGNARIRQAAPRKEAASNAEAKAETALLTKIQTSSVSLLLLSVALERSTAVLCLRVLQLHALERRALLEEVEVRYEFFKCRRVMRAWHQHTVHAALRRTRMVTLVVSVWKQAVRQGAERRRIVSRFCRAVRSRAMAFRACQRGQLARCFERWRQKFTLAREEHLLNDKISMFQRKHRPRRHLLPYSSPLVVLGDTLAIPTSERFALYRVFSHWKSRTERRVELRLASAQYDHAVMLRVFRRWREAFLYQGRMPLDTDTGGDAGTRGVLPLPLPPAAAPASASSSAATAAAVGGGEIPITTASCRRVNVVARPDTLWRYKALCASRIGAGVTLKECFQHWKRTFHNRIADRQYIRRARQRCLVVWLERTISRSDERAMKAVVLQRWREALSAREARHVAAAHCERRVLRRCLSVWYQRAAEKQAVRTFRLRRLFVKWRSAALVPAFERLRCRRSVRTAFELWRGRSEARFTFRTNYIAAITVRETVLLVSAFQWWRTQYTAHRRRRLSCEVFQDLRVERKRRLCFQRWKQRVFGPYPQLQLQTS